MGLFLHLSEMLTSAAGGALTPSSTFHLCVWPGDGNSFLGYTDTRA